MDRLNIFGFDARACLLIVVLFLAGSSIAGQWDRHGRRIIVHDTDSVESDTIVTKPPDLKSAAEAGGSIFALGSAGIGTVAFLSFGLGIVENNYVLSFEIENGTKLGIRTGLVNEVDSKNILFGREFIIDPSLHLCGLAGVGFLKGKFDGKTFYSTMTFPVIAECCILATRFIGVGIGLKASFNRYASSVGIMLRIRAGTIK